ncbi:MAG: hypothetical protein ACJ74U_16085 [Jatrophihabitantaceae bacterium]
MALPAARIRPRQDGFRSDPHSPAVYALELYDGELTRPSVATGTLELSPDGTG